MNASEMKDHMNEVLIKMSQVMAKQNEFEKEFCSKAEFGSTSVDENESANNTSKNSVLLVKVQLLRNQSTKTINLELKQVPILTRKT